MLRMWTASVSTLALALLVAGPAPAEERSFTIANVEYEGTKAFLPSTLIVRQGDTVKLRILNNVPGDPNQHGFAIPDYGIEKVVTRGEPQDVEFAAEKTGLFPIKCHLHAAHLGGQLLVLGNGDGTKK